MGTYGNFFQVGMGYDRPKPQFIIQLCYINCIMYSYLRNGYQYSSTISKKWYSNGILITDLCPKLHLTSSTFPRSGLHLLVASRYSDTIPLYKRMLE